MKLTFDRVHKLTAIFLFFLVFPVDAFGNAEIMNDDKLPRICADVLDSPDQRTKLEEQLEGSQVEIVLVADTFSKLHSRLSGEFKYQMGARKINIAAGIDISNLIVPSNFKKGDTFVVRGKIEGAVLWGNVYEGCYLNIIGNEILIDGF